MSLLKEIITEARGPTVGESEIMDVVAKNIRLTDRFGGPVRFSIVRNKQIAMALDDDEGKREDFVRASITKTKDGQLAWNVKEGIGLAKFKLKKISDGEMAAVMRLIFKKAAKKK
jgi:hypothetical protein